jgi:hypothetical protein
MDCDRGNVVLCIPVVVYTSHELDARWEQLVRLVVWRLAVGLEHVRVGLVTRSTVYISWFLVTTLRDILGQFLGGALTYNKHEETIRHSETSSSALQPTRQKSLCKIERC